MKTYRPAIRFFFFVGSPLESAVVFSPHGCVLGSAGHVHAGLVHDTDNPGLQDELLKVNLRGGGRLLHACAVERLENMKDMLMKPMWIILMQ